MRHRTRQHIGVTRESPPIELTNLADLALILAFVGLLVPHLVLIPSTELATSTGAALSSMPREPVTILLRDGGSVYWNQEAIPWSELELRVQRVKENSRPPKLFLVGERSAPLGLNIDVRTLLQGTDFVEVALQKEP